MGLSYVYLGRATGEKDPTKWNEAKDFLLEGIHIFEAQKAKPFYSQGYLFLGELNADIGHKKEALENLELAEQMFTEMGMEFWLARTQETLKRL